MHYKYFNYALLWRRERKRNFYGFISSRSGKSYTFSFSKFVLSVACLSDGFKSSHVSLLFLLILKKAWIFYNFNWLFQSYSQRNIYVELKRYFKIAGMWIGNNFVRKKFQSSVKTFSFEFVKQTSIKNILNESWETLLIKKFFSIGLIWKHLMCYFV